MVTALRREGIVGREPDAGTRLREGDVLVLWGTPEDLEHGENRLLMGCGSRKRIGGQRT